MSVYCRKANRVGINNQMLFMTKEKGTAGYPSTTGNPSGGGRDNDPPKK